MKNQRENKLSVICINWTCFTCLLINILSIVGSFLETCIKFSLFFSKITFLNQFLSFKNFWSKSFYVSLRQFTFYYLNLRKFTSNHRAGKTHFLHNFTLTYPILPKFIKNYHILRKILSNSHPCTYIHFSFFPFLSFSHLLYRKTYIFASGAYAPNFPFELNYSDLRILL